MKVLEQNKLFIDLQTAYNKVISEREKEKRCLEELSDWEKYLNSRSEELSRCIEFFFTAKNTKIHDMRNRIQVLQLEVDKIKFKEIEDEFDRDSNQDFEVLDELTQTKKMEEVTEALQKQNQDLKQHLETEQI